MKYAGAAYLIYLGVQRWRGGEEDPASPEAQPRGALFRQGMLVNVLNPKTAIFFLAFLPQFVDPSMAVAPQVLVLGAEFIAIAVISDGAYAVVAGTLGEAGRVGRETRRQPVGQMETHPGHDGREHHTARDREQGRAGEDRAWASEGQLDIAPGESGKQGCQQQHA